MARLSPEIVIGLRIAMDWRDALKLRLAGATAFREFLARALAGQCAQCGQPATTAPVSPPGVDVTRMSDDAEGRRERPGAAPPDLTLYWRGPQPTGYTEVRGCHEWIGVVTLDGADVTRRSVAVLYRGAEPVAAILYDVDAEGNKLLLPDRSGLRKQLHLGAITATLTRRLEPLPTLRAGVA